MFDNNNAAKYIAACVIPCLWMTVSSTLILLNKHLMSTKGFSYPMAMSSLGQIFSAVAATLCCKIFDLGNASTQVTLRYYLTKILPVGCFMATTLMAGNAVYLYLSVAFIQMLKAFTPVFTMIGLFLAALEIPSVALVASVCVIAIGTATAGYGEINFSVIGVILMTVSESAEALRLVMTQTMLQGLRFHPIEGVMYLSPACVMWMMVGVWTFEAQRMLDDDALAIVRANPGLFGVAASLGFVCNVLVFFTIQLCGSLTLKVLGTSKNAGLVLFCVMFLGEHVTRLQGFGYSIALTGFSWYQYIKITQGTEKLRESHKQDATEAIPLTRSVSTPKSSSSDETLYRYYSKQPSRR